MKPNRRMKILFGILILSLIALPVLAQKKTQETVLKREVTLYNPYKPSLSDAPRKNYLPDLTDTSKVKTNFKYDLRPEPFMPGYTVSQIKPATLLPDPLSKLYNSYINAGIGYYLTPLAEISITNQRSKKGAIGIFARHFSTNGKTKLDNGIDKGFAGYMDNDLSVFGKKFLQNSIFYGSADLSQKTRYAYGIEPYFTAYNPPKKNIRLNYYNAGATLGLASNRLDSTSLAYNFTLSYHFFDNIESIYQHNIDFKGQMARSYREFYIGTGMEFDNYSFSDSAFADPRYIASLSPFIKKSSEQWALKAGFQALLDKTITGSVKPHFYPDVNFSFVIVPSYLSFFADLSGRLVKNVPINVIRENPFILPDSTLFKINNTDYSLVVKGGLTGSSGIEGNYQLSASYSIVNNMLFFTNLVNILDPTSIQKGNFFKPLYDNVEILNVHGELGGRITDLLSFSTEANFYRYTLSKQQYAWNKPGWDVSAGFKYNLKDKIIAGLDFNALGERKLLVSANPPLYWTITKKAHFNINLSAEYRYTRILSFWFKLNNISLDRYYEWANYPSLRFMAMVGFTYSL